MLSEPHAGGSSPALPIKPAVRCFFVPPSLTPLFARAESPDKAATLSSKQASKPAHKKTAPHRTVTMMMMKSSPFSTPILLLLLLLLCSWWAPPPSSEAFPAALRRTSTSSSRSSRRNRCTATRLHGGASADDPRAAEVRKRIKRAGGGVPTVAAGDTEHFWDPGEEGQWGGTGVLEARLRQGFRYNLAAAPSGGTSTAATAAAATTIDSADIALQDCQHWLEGGPEFGPGCVPPVFAKATRPVPATVLGRGRLIAEAAPGDIQHLVLELPAGMHYVEGQSLSVIPPGTDIKGKPHKPRLYSIASTRYGDLLDGRTVSLCVRRAEHVDPATGRVDPAKKGVCSNFLCDVGTGETVQVAGPVGKTMLLPADSTQDIILVATGTGIAPFRGFLHRLFVENTVARHQFTGHAWLILGVPVTGGLLYADELQAMRQNAAASGLHNLEVTYAISREMKNASGSKLYVQDVLRERADELFERLESGAAIYFCGLKGMMPGILEALEAVARQRGLDWTATLQQLKANHQWHVEVY